MAWTTPRDWTAISDGIVTAAMLNIDVRDNLGFLGVHTHTGAAGMGASTMSGLTLTSLGTLTFADQSANPDAAGELQRNGNDILFYGASAVTLSAADAITSTASLRTLGTGARQAAAGDHTHDLGAEVDQATTSTTDTQTGTSDADDIPGHSAQMDVAATTETTLLTRTFTTTDDDVVWAFAYVLAVGQNTTGVQSYIQMRLYIDGALQQNHELRSRNAGYTHGGYDNAVLTGSVEKVAGTYSSTLRVYNEDSTSQWYKFISMGLVMGSVNGKFA